MADGNPKFGGTGGVPLLDIGQIGGSRQAAGTALFSGNVMIGEDEAASVENVPVQQSAPYRDVLGYLGRVIQWEGVIRTSSVAMWATIMSEMNEKRHGALRDSSTGRLLPAQPGMIVETQLTDSFGTVLSGRAVLMDWQMRVRMFKSSAWTVVVPVRLRFRDLG